MQIFLYLFNPPSTYLQYNFCCVKYLIVSMSFSSRLQDCANVHVVFYNALQRENTCSYVASKVDFCYRISELDICSVHYKTSSVSFDEECHRIHCIWGSAFFLVNVHVCLSLSFLNSNLFLWRRSMASLWSFGL